MFAATLLAIAVSIAALSAVTPASDLDHSVNGKLTNVLLSRTNKYVRPVREPRQQLVIHVSSALYQIVDLDQRNNLATISAYFDLFWTDERLKWNPADYDGVTNTYLPSKNIWMPELYLYHSISGSTGLYFKETMSQVDYRGTVRLFMPFTARALCPINVKHFPFDTQVCQFLFGSWSYKKESVKFLVETADVFLGDFYDNQEWLLLNSSLSQGTANYSTAASNETYSMVVMKLTIHRQSFYYVFNLVIPITLVSVVAAIGFHAPGNAGAQRRETKFRLGIMTLLSMSVMLLMLVDEMPNFALESIPGQRGSFSDVPLLGLFYITLIFLMSVCTCTSSLFVHLERYAFTHPKLEQIPRCLRWVGTGCEPFKAKIFHPSKKRQSGQHLPSDGVDMDETAVVYKESPKPESEWFADTTLPTISTRLSTQHWTNHGQPTEYTMTETPLVSMGGDEPELRYFRPKPLRRSAPSMNSSYVSTPTAVDGVRVLVTKDFEKTADALLDKLAHIDEALRANLKRKRDVDARKSLPQHWERVISRVEMMSQTFYLGSIALCLLLFYMPTYWYPLRSGDF